MSVMAKKRPADEPSGKPRVPLKPVVGFRAEPDLHEALELLAAEEQRKMAQLIAILVKEAMAARGRYQHPKPIKPKRTPEP